MTQAQLGLLLALEQAGGSTKAKQVSAQHLFALQPIQRLLGCKALDLAPEDPGMRQAQQIGAGGRFGDTSLTTLRYVGHSMTHIHTHTHTHTRAEQTHVPYWYLGEEAVEEGP